MKDKSIQKQLLEEIARVGQDDGVEALTEEKIGEICKKYNFSEAEFIGLETEIFSAGNVTSLSDNEETLENVAGGKLDIKKSTATLLAALNVASPFASSAFATGTKKGSPKIDTVKTRTQTPTDINSKRHNNSSKERIAKMYENATKYVQEKFGLTREKAKSIVSSDYISQKYQSAIKYVQENFGLSRVQAESVVAAMGVTGSLATTLFIHKAYKTLTPKKPRTNTSEKPVTHIKMQALAYSIEEYKQQILKDCKVRDILGTEPMFVFEINDNEKSLYVIIKSIVNNNLGIKIVQEIEKSIPHHFVLSKEEAKELFSVDEIKVGTKISDRVAKDIANFINWRMIDYTSNNDDALEEEKKEEVKVEEEKKEEVKEEEKKDEKKKDEVKAGEEKKEEGKNYFCVLSYEVGKGRRATKKYKYLLQFHRSCMELKRRVLEKLESADINYGEPEEEYNTVKIYGEPGEEYNTVKIYGEPEEYEIVNVENLSPRQSKSLGETLRTWELIPG